MGVRHSFTSAKADSADATKVQPSHWNDDHTATAAGIMYAGTDGGDISNVTAAQNYLYTLRRKFNASSTQEFEFAAPPQYISTDYNFTAQNFSATLTAGVGATITLTPVPLGVVGVASTYGRYLYISDGANSEAVLITGGTATSGAATGTITFTPANNHNDGAWSVQSATAGVQEAVVLAEAAGRGKIKIPAGTHTMLAPVEVRGDAIDIEGEGRLSTYLYYPGDIAGFYFRNWNGSAYTQKVHNSLRNVSFGALAVGANGTCILAYNQFGLILDDIVISKFASGILLTDTTLAFVNRADIREFAENGTSTGIKIVEAGTNTSNSNFISNCVIQGEDPGVNPPSYGSGAGINLAGGGGIYLISNDILNSRVGLLVNPATGKEVRWLFATQCAFDSHSDQGIYFEVATGGKIKSAKFVNCWSGSNRQEGVRLSAAGTGTIENPRFVGCTIINNYKSGIIVGAGTTDLALLGNDIACNNSEDGASGHGVYVAAGITDFTIIGNYIGDYVDSTLSQSKHRYNIIVDTGASDRYIICANHLYGYTTGPLSDAGTGVNKTITGNLPSTADKYPTSASGLTVGTLWNDTGTIKIKT